MFENCLYFNTTALARTLEREYAKAFKPFGLTPSQAFMLRAVLEKPGLLQSELATALVISRSTATRTLDGLQQMKLLERRATASDGRESAIEPTAAALAIGDQLKAAGGEISKRMKSELGLAHFEDAVSKVRNIRSTLA
jgi:DNA-binding MarR family transcriptional regulator